MNDQRSSVNHTPTWSGNTVSLPLFINKDNRHINYEIECDFDDLGVDRGGLLEESFMAFSYPGTSSKFQIFTSMLNGVCENPVATMLLSEPACRHTRETISKIYELFESYIINNTDVATKDVYSGISRTIFRACENPTKHGDLIRDISYTPSIKSRKIEAKRKGGILNQSKLINIDHANHQDHRSAVLSMMKDDLKTIEDACWKSIDSFKKLSTYMRGINDGHGKNNKRYTSYGVRPRLSADQLVANRFIFRNKNNYHRYDNYVTGNQDTPIGKADGLEIEAKILELCDGMKFSHSFASSVMTDLFMPRFAIVAAEILCTIYTNGWNTSTVIALTNKDISKVGSHYKLSSIKSKSDQLPDVSVYKSKQPRFYELIELLIEHNNNIDKYWKRNNNSIFVSFSGGSAATVTSSGSALATHLLRPHGLKHFARKQIRDQVANIVYLETNDPFYVKELLGHADIATTLHYLNQHAIRLLNDGNMRLFMDKLAATIVWVAKDEEAVETMGMKKKHIDKKLLFPVSHVNASSSSHKSDDWIASQGNDQIMISTDDIAHLNYQIDYYKNYAITLKQANPKDYLLNHVPRMIFCTALAEVIRNSRFSKLLNVTEDQ